MQLPISDASHYYEHFETGRCFPAADSGSFHQGRLTEKGQKTK